MVSAERLRDCSQYFSDIYGRKEDLVARLLAFSDDPNDSLINENQDKLMAFKLLMHAEIEYYIECLTKDVIEQCRNAWLSSYKLNPILLRLLIYNQSAYTGNCRDNDTKDRITFMLTNALTLINDNHGIKEKNLLKMLQQIGVNVISNHNTLTNDLESYGNHRGVIAHTGITHITSTSRPLIKVVEIRKIDQLLESLSDLDLDIKKLRGYIAFPVSFSANVGI